MKTAGLSLIAACLCILVAGLIPTTPTDAQHCNRSQVSYSSYVAPVQAYVAPVQQYYAPQVIQVPVQAEYYYSTNDYYRSQQEADAIVGKLAVLIAQQNGNAEADQYRQLLELVVKLQLNQQGNVTGQIPIPPGASKSELAHPAMVEYVSKACLKCHSGKAEKGVGLSLENLDALNEVTRWKMYGMVNSGEMPKGGQPAPDELIPLFYAFAKGVKATQQAPK